MQLIDNSLIIQYLLKWKYERSANVKPLTIATLTSSCAFIPLFIFNGVYSAMGGGLLMGYFAFEITYFYKIENNRHKNIGEMNQKRWNLRRL